MMVIDDELDRKERDRVLAQLTQAGVNISSWSELERPENRSQASETVLLECLPSLTESRTAMLVLSMLGLHACRPETLRGVIDYFRTLKGISYDHWVQFTQRRELHPTRTSALSRAWQREAEYAIEKGWYLSYDPPVRGPVLVYQEGFPSPDVSSAYHESTVQNWIANLLDDHANPDIFDAVANLVTDPFYGYGRMTLLDALVKCDRGRAPGVLMKVLNDPDIGGCAMARLAKLGYEPASPYFEKFASHPIRWVSTEAKKALAKLARKRGRRSPAGTVQLKEVLSMENRLKAAEILVAQSLSAKDAQKFSRSAVGSAAKAEGKSEYSTSVAPGRQLKALLQQLAKSFGGDFAGPSAQPLVEEMREAGEEAWEAYRMNVTLSSGESEEVWFQYDGDEGSGIGISLYGSDAFIAQVRDCLTKRKRK